MARPVAAVAFLTAICAPALVFDHPLVLAGSLAAVVVVGLAASVGRELARAARYALPLALLVALINPIVSREGLTVLFAGPVVPVLGALDITLEAVVQGAVTALRAEVVLLGFALYSAVVDPDQVLRLFRRLSFRSALTASLATRLVPVLGRDAVRLSEAYGLRAAAPALENERMPRLRRGALLTRALAAGALDRAVDLAAALEVRGYASAPRAGATRWPRAWSRHDFAFALAALAIAVVAAAGLAAGSGHFDAYPSLQASFGPADLALAAAPPLLALVPFAAARRVRRKARS